MDRITAIQKSLAAFVYGIIGMLPVIGLVPAFCALRLGSRVRSQYRGEWNPAVIYLRAGVAFAGFGIFSTLLLLVVLTMVIAMS
jgi:hypothetical protein